MAGPATAAVTVLTARSIQWGIAAIFFVLGGWALMAPQSVIDLTLLPQYRVGTPILPFAIACFGAQALIAGLFAAFARFTRATFLAFGIALLPFFVFDAAGNAAMLVLCVIGWRRAEA
jgi:hypothetical protein